MNTGLAFLVVFLAIAVYTDLHDRKVDNRLVLTGFVTASIFHLAVASGSGVLSATGGSIGVLDVVGGIAVGFAALFPLYALRAMGAGDVKLMMMVGAFLGPLQALGVVVLTFAVGGVLALVMALWQRSLGQVVANLRFMLITSMVRTAGGGSPRLEPLQHTAGRMPYAVAIAAGTVLQLVLVRSGGWALS